MKYQKVCKTNLILNRKYVLTALTPPPEKVYMNRANISEKSGVLLLQHKTCSLLKKFVDIFNIFFISPKGEHLKKRLGDKIRFSSEFAKYMYMYTSILNLQGTSSCFQSVKIVWFHFFIHRIFQCCKGGIQTLTDSKNVMKSKPKMECWNALPHCVASTAQWSSVK